jgi:hypothetical protein
VHQVGRALPAHHRPAADHGQDPEAHEQVAVAVEDHRRAVWHRERDPEADGGGHAHRADHVEVLHPILDRERLAADVAVGVDHRLALERGHRRAQRLEARDAGGG